MLRWKLGTGGGPYLVNYERDKARIVAHRGKHDGPEHTAVLKKVLQLMGVSTHTSLKRTMGDYLESTQGAKRNSTLNLAEEQLTSKLRSENDTAERCFAVLRDLHKWCPSMSLVNLMGVSLARLNKTFKAADGDFAGGASIISDPPFDSARSRTVLDSRTLR